MPVRGVRGATTILQDSPDNIAKATQELLDKIIEDNSIETEDIASVLFSVTPDIHSDFPAKTARLMGWDQVPLFCFQEIPVSGALPLCIRVLIHVNTEKKQKEIKHIYLREAKILRKDL